MILYSSSQKHSISRAAFAKVAGIGAEVRLHAPFEVAVERRRIEVVEETHGNDAAFTPRHSMQPLKKSCTYWQQSAVLHLIEGCFGSRFVSFGTGLKTPASLIVGIPSQLAEIPTTRMYP